MLKINSKKHEISFSKGFFTLLLIFFSFFLYSNRAEAQTSFKRVSSQYIAALGDANSNAGTGAELWGHWAVDPGPRGVWVKDYTVLKESGGIAPARWKFNDSDWWLEEHGLIMEEPNFPLPPGKYVVTGGRKVTTILTIHAPDQKGISRWELDKGATLYDVTHLPCRAARYTPLSGNSLCSPVKVDKSLFPLRVGAIMPFVEGCHKQNYAVLFVIGVDKK